MLLIVILDQYVSVLLLLVNDACSGINIIIYRPRAVFLVLVYASYAVDLNPICAPLAIVVESSLNQVARLLKG